MKMALFLHCRRFSLMSKMTFTYKEAVEKINSLQTKADLLDKLRKAGPRSTPNLDSMRVYLERIGYHTRDFDRLNMIHVTGTKGKGSTCAFTQSILKDQNIRTGLFTSPHLIAARERIRINGVPISETLFAQYVSEVWTSLEKTKAEVLIRLKETEETEKDILMNQKDHPDKPSYFRFMTLVALHTFMQENLDCVILEVGVGGEYDSTNVIEKPVVCASAALGLDHLAQLGTTIDKIAWHKSGIFKQDVPAVILEAVPEAYQVIKQRAKDKNVALTVIDSKKISKLDGFELGIAGEHQKQNAALAIELSKIWLKEVKGISISDNDGIPEEFKKGLTTVRWPGRAQKLEVEHTKYASKVSNKVTWYLDGAHTIESLEACCEWFKKAVKNRKEEDGDDKNKQSKNLTRILMFNCTHGRNSKELLGIISKIQPRVKFNEIIFTTNMTFRKGFSSDNTDRNVSEESVLSLQKEFKTHWLELNPSFIKNNINCQHTIEEAVEYIINRSKDTDVQVLATGSLLMVGNTLTVLGIEPQ